MANLSNGSHSPRAWMALVLAGLLGASAVTGRNTLQGAGQDVENAGDVVKDAVD
jgi:predicted small secreted protein